MLVLITKNQVKFSQIYKCIINSLLNIPLLPNIMLYENNTKSRILRFEIFKPRITLSFIFDITRKYIDFNISLIFFEFTFNKHFGI